MKNFFAVLLFLMVCVNIFAQEPSAEELLRRVDDNEIYDTIVYEGEMIIEYQKRRYVKTMRAAARGSTDSFIEFTNKEDAGTKYLKKGSKLYVYSPDIEKVVLISGHMLKESIMGSDLSYEDTVNNDTLSSRYTPVLAGSAVYNEKNCYLLELSAKNKTESYPKQKLWIDKSSGDLVHSEQFALSGAKLKEFTLLKTEQIGKRRFPVQYEMRDAMRKDSRTIFVMNKIELDKPVAESVFSIRNLER
ncbi:MAG: outer membrane lipoprotein-sorting protein [Spirochaetaceae bacterium]|jgi:outer membrane lipoprotein-sorting protein|nr:outer membrane lipoprotein-sorting protein [Spirochaetaceae bacterium]